MMKMHPHLCCHKSCFVSIFEKNLVGDKSFSGVKSHFHKNSVAEVYYL